MSSPVADLDSLDHLIGKQAVRAVRTPTVLQMEALDCGPAALAIVLAYYGRWVGVEELRAAAGVSRNGSTALNLLSVARDHGLEVRALKAEPESLRYVRAPMILHWRFNHFVVLEGFLRGDRVRINDPRNGPREISLEELDKNMTGVVLAARPGAGFRPEGMPPSLYRALRQRLRGSLPALAFLFLVSLFLMVPTLMVPGLTRMFVDRVLVAGESGWLAPVFGGLAVGAVLLGVLTWLQRRHLLRLETRMSIVESSRFLWHLLRLPLEFYHQRYTGDISARVALNDRIARMLSRDVASNALGALVIAVLGGFMLRIDAVLTLASLGVISLNLLVLRWLSRKRIDSHRRLLREQGNLNGIALWGLETIESLKATGSESDLFSRWAGQQARVVNLRQELEKSNLPLETLPALLGALNTALILGFGGSRVLGGELTLGSLVAFQMLSVAFVAPAQRLVNLAGRLQLVDGELALCADVLQAAPVVDVEPRRCAGEAAGRLRGELEVCRVTFGYGTREAPVVQDVDLRLEPGRWTAIVGETGSGKSTVAKLIAGLYEPWQGEVLFDGRPRHAIDRSLHTRSVAVVDQDILVFEGSVRDNLTLWDASVPEERLVAACRDAEILDEIRSRPGGFDGTVDEGGVNWSGGQLQRLEIARALAGDPRLLILDEATSALDPETEHKVIANLRRRDLSCLVAAHRLSTVRDADEILVLDQGRVVERGRHDQLVHRGGLYARLVVHE